MSTPLPLLLGTPHDIWTARFALRLRTILDVVEGCRALWHDAETFDEAGKRLLRRSVLGFIDDQGGVRPARFITNIMGEVGADDAEQIRAIFRQLEAAGLIAPPGVGVGDYLGPLLTENGQELLTDLLQHQNLWKLVQGDPLGSGRCAPCPRVVGPVADSMYWLIPAGLDPESFGLPAPPRRTWRECFWRRRLWRRWHG